MERFSVMEETSAFAEIVFPRRAAPFHLFINLSSSLFPLISSFHVDAVMLYVSHFPKDEKKALEILIDGIKKESREFSLSFSPP
jgi:hypothetical protein